MLYSEDDQSLIGRLPDVQSLIGQMMHPYVERLLFTTTSVEGCKQIKASSLATCTNCFNETHMQSVHS